MQGVTSRTVRTEHHGQPPSVIGRSTSRALGHRENRLIIVSVYMELSIVAGTRVGIPGDTHMSDIWYNGVSTDKRVPLTEISKYKLLNIPTHQQFSKKKTFQCMKSG